MGAVGAKNLQRYRAPRGMKPLSAAIDMTPAFKNNPFGVFALEHIAGKLVIGAPISKTLDMRFTPPVEFGFFGFYTAVRTGKDQHGSGSLYQIDQHGAEAPLQGSGNRK